MSLHLSTKKQLRVYVYNDLPFYKKVIKEDILEELIGELRKNKNVVITNIDKQVTYLSTTAQIASFDTTIAIGNSGRIVAELIHAKTGWFPHIVQFPITRKEVSAGRYVIPEEMLLSVKNYFQGTSLTTLAIVDDTLYSGLTLSSILQSLPKPLLKKTQIFLLQGLSATIQEFQKDVRVSVALEIDGIPEKEVTIIKASGLFTKGAIRPATGPDLAFFERPEWMQTWFPTNFKKIVALCKKIYLSETSVPLYL